MLEVYLFINPISETCYQTEKKIIKLLTIELQVRRQKGKL